MARDVAFQLLPSNFMQTATNTAAGLTSAAIGAGFVADPEEAEIYFDSQRDRIFEALVEQVKLDNASLKADFDAAPNKTYNKSGGTNTGGAKAPSADDNTFTWGKYSGKTIEEVYTLDPSYIDWLVNKDTNEARNTMRDRARVVLDALKAGV